MRLRLALAGLLILAVVALVLVFRRAGDYRYLERVEAELEQAAAGERFSEAMVAPLPGPARRYLLRAIGPGTPLARSVRLRMRGAFRLVEGGERVAMVAEQLLATPRGLVWRARIGRGLRAFSGYDLYARGEGRMRWWLWGLVPVLSASGADVTRSAAGRVAVEAIWLPPALLPGRGAAWESVDDRSARVSLHVGEETATLKLTVDGKGRLERVEMMRWSTTAEGGQPAYARFGADGFGEERVFSGYTLPTRLRAGWRLGQPGEHAFFFPVLESAEFR